MIPKQEIDAARAARRLERTMAGSERRWGRGRAEDSTAARALIELHAVTKSFESEAGLFHALRAVDLVVEPGEFVAVIGKSGSGKSTLINMIAGIDRPTEGEVWVAGTGVHDLREGKLAAWRGKSLGIVFQFFQLLPTLTVIENVMLPMDFCKTYPTRERAPRAMALLETVDLADQAHKLPSAISGGQQQRAAIARSLANDPPILLADEPTGNLDSRTAEDVERLFEDLVAGGKTILIVTHDDDLAARVARTLVIADGRIVEQRRRGVKQPEASVQVSATAAAGAHAS
jgi:putative ABC transport system ATP-binding protein